MKKSAVILLFIPYLLEAVLNNKPSNTDICVGNDIKLNWKFDPAGTILVAFYKVKVPGGSLVTILTYNGIVANVINNYNVKWDNDAGPVTIVNPTINNTGDYSIDVAYSGGSIPADAHTVSVLVSDPPKTLDFTKSGAEFTCTLGSPGTPSVSLYSQLNDVKQTTPTVTADIYQKVECCINGTAVTCMPGQTEPTYCITAQSPITSTAEPTTTFPTSTTTTTTATSATTDVQTTASITSEPTTATLTVTATTMSAPTTATSIVTAPTMSAPSSATTTVTAPTTATLTVIAPTTSASLMATSTIIAPTTSAPTTASQTVTSPTTSPIISSTPSTTYQSLQNNMDEAVYIIVGCIGGAIVVALLIVIPLCLLRGPMCKGWRSKKPYETSKDPRAKHSSARHHRHGGNSHTGKQYQRPQKSRTSERSFPNHYNNPAYVGPAGRRSGYHVHTSNPPSYTFYDPFSSEYFRTAEQSRGHSVGQRYAPYPQSQHRGRMQQTWYQPYMPGRPGFYDNSGNGDFYY